MLKIWLAVFLTALLPANALAQLAIGDWQIYNNYSPNVVKVLDTGHKVYFLTGGNLYSYDKDSEETFGYTSRNSLNDVDIADFYRHPDRNYILIAYESGNIDLLDDSGSTVNLSDIKDAQYVSDRTINDVAFDDDCAYVATGFGLVKFNLKNHSVAESGIYASPVTAVTVMDSHLLICMDGHIYTMPKSGRISSFGSFTDLGELNANNMEAISSEIVLSADKSNGKVNVFRPQPDTQSISVLRNWNLPSSSDILPLGSRYMVSNSGGFFVVKAENGEYSASYHETPSESRASGRNYYSLGLNNDNSLWYINSLGLGRMRYDSNMENPEHVMMPSRPAGTNIADGVQRMTMTDSGTAYLYNVAANRYPNVASISAPANINSFTNGFIEDITPATADVEIRNSNSSGALRAAFNIVSDPDDPEAYYMGTWFEGIYKIKDGKQVMKYDWTNSPLTMDYCGAAMNIAIDPQGNLWVYHRDNNKPAPNVGVYVLPASKRRLDSSSASDWIALNLPRIKSDDTRNALIYPCSHPKNKNIVFISEGYEDKNLCTYFTNGTIDNLSDDSSYIRNKFVDQDGRSFGPASITAMVEDHNGDIWVGTEDGVIVIHNAQAMTTATGTVERVKVPRNDGTNYADYLLQNQQVSAIAVDGANRKWIATTASGVYLVSADGKEIIENFNTDNSYLPSNTVHTVACDPTNNKVYFGTEYGLAAYSSTSAPAENDYSEVYAYPNPVRPEYTGWITIKGLMDHSLVKIADTAGNVFYQTRSEGGMVIWDGCNPGGERVRTGVYFVYASQNEDGSTGDVVAKILVVN
ncbi:MAG: hypothetical protein NC127_07760 [Muribaculum sp.]|nr:hypothetical protein [Muribaculum sp.]